MESERQDYTRYTMINDMLNALCEHRLDGDLCGYDNMPCAICTNEFCKNLESAQIIIDRAIKYGIKLCASKHLLTPNN